MGLPESIRVKISSEEAQSISLTPVVLREMPVRELIEALLGVAGKDAERIRRLLGRGAVVSGGSRLRWEGWTADLDAIRAVLATFPDPEPARPFAAAACVRAVLRGGNTRIEISREVGMERRLFRKERFWDALMEAAAAAAPRYAGYSYRERADHYSVEIARETAAWLRECAARLRYSSLEERVCRAHLEALELFVERR
jgi:hypothetical protein